MDRDGWCGPAIVNIALAAVGIRKSQESIMRHVYMPRFGTTQDSLFAYLSQYFRKVGFKTNARLRHVRYHLSRGHIVIVNWWDDLDEDDEDDGHYTIVQSVHCNGQKMRMIDPSDRGIWDIKTRVFLNRWYDYLDARNSKRLDRWLMWMDPVSKVPQKRVSRRSS